MAGRRVQGDFMLTQGYTVANGQVVEPLDFVSYTGATVQRASDMTWASAISTTTPTVADSAVSVGSGLANSATGVKISYNFPWGEGTLSSVGSATPTLNASLKVSGIAPQSPATSTNVYVETSAGSGVYKLYAVTVGDNVLVTGYGNGRVPPTAVSQAATALTQYAFAQVFLGVSNQRMPTSGPPAIYGTPTRPFGNSADNTIMVCRGGVFEYDCASATFLAGSYVGPAKDTGNALLDQKVVAVDNASLAIGKVFKDVTSSTRVMVEMMSRWRTPAPMVYPHAW